MEPQAYPALGRGVSDLEPPAPPPLSVSQSVSHAPLGQFPLRVCLHPVATDPGVRPVPQGVLEVTDGTGCVCVVLGMVGGGPGPRQWESRWKSKDLRAD